MLSWETCQLSGVRVSRAQYKGWGGLGGRGQGGMSAASPTTPPHLVSPTQRPESAHSAPTGLDFMVPEEPPGRLGQPHASVGCESPGHCRALAGRCKRTGTQVGVEWRGPRGCTPTHHTHTQRPECRPSTTRINAVQLS